LILKQRRPLVTGDVARDRLYLRIFNDSAAFAPPGHTVIQAMLTTSYDFWARQGTRYQREKQRVADEVLERVAVRLPEIAGRVRMIDVATPLTFWRYARSWRGAYEGWLPTPKTLRARVPKRFPMIEGLYLAGQWVQPGGGVPPALLSGRHLVQVLCEQAGRPFESHSKA
jgi:phytoene dehydrogenase-like protein